MKLKNLLFAFALFTFVVQLSAQKSLPSIDLKTLGGEKVNLQDFASDGKITVVSFWATWCSPCKKELDAIADLYPDWQEEYDMELVAVTIDTRRALAKVPGMVATKGWEYTILTDDVQASQNALGFQTIPQTYLIDQKGQIVYSHNGYVPGDELELEDKIEALSKK